MPAEAWDNAERLERYEPARAGEARAFEGRAASQG